MLHFIISFLYSEEVVGFFFNLSKVTQLGCVFIAFTLQGKPPLFPVM